MHLSVTHRVEKSESTYTLLGLVYFWDWLTLRKISNYTSQVLQILVSHIIICFCCASCRSGTQQVKSVSGEAWWSTTTAASMPSSLCTT